MSDVRISEDDPPLRETAGRSVNHSSDLSRWLRERSAYPDPFDTPVVLHETHISWVFLAGDYAYKVKKPVKNDFIDYSTLQRREHFCHEELRLNRRFVEGLYIAVVPITRHGQPIRVEGLGEPIEYAVKMHRFAENDLLSYRLAADLVTDADVLELAASVARFHQSAARPVSSQRWGSLEVVLGDADDNFHDLQMLDWLRSSTELAQLHRWTKQFADTERSRIALRREQGFVRECHGDLHLDNVVRWRGQITPFDGIEFCERFRWIDLLSDAAFLMMDLAARGHHDWGRVFINAYLDFTGDHSCLAMLRWYLVYRAMVRAKVAAIRGQQAGVSQRQRRDAREDCQRHLQLAQGFSRPSTPRIWITHGVSGSGKTLGCQAVIKRQGAIRLRSDVERKRHHHLELTQRPDDSRQRAALYSHRANDETYASLLGLAQQVVQDGFSVIVDATFLRRRQRRQFRKLAESLKVPFTILDFDVDPATLRKRVIDRLARGTDASDADLSVLEWQLATRQPLTPMETRYVERPTDGGVVAEL
jgi:aminoglycoside phosphotransferase family enzyme/predicted kinase